MQLPQLKRIRWAVRAALFLGVAASVAANVLHAQPNIISQVISAWPPLALLLTVELTSRIPMHKPLLAFVRVLATVAIAGIAAWVSYWHMQGVAVKYGETEASAFLLPISVDGLIVVASVSLVELAGRIRFFEEKLANPAPAAAPAVAPVQFVQPAPTAPVFQSPVQAAAIEAAELEEIEEALEFDDAAEPLSVGGTVHGVRTPSAAPVSPAVGPAPRPRQRAATRAAASAPARTMVTETTGPKQGPRPVIETAELADAIIAMEPGITEEKLADRLNMTVSRLRAVRKEAENRRAAAARG